MNHQLHRCDAEACNICDGGLASCNVCGGAEASLPTDCPGIRMTLEQMALVQLAELDFNDGKWKRAGDVL